jgi:hypothetical protein
MFHPCCTLYGSLLLLLTSVLQDIPGTFVEPTEIVHLREMLMELLNPIARANSHSRHVEGTEEPQSFLEDIGSYPTKASARCEQRIVGSFAEESTVKILITLLNVSYDVEVALLLCKVLPGARTVLFRTPRLLNAACRAAIEVGVGSGPAAEWSSYLRSPLSSEDSKSIEASPHYHTRMFFGKPSPSEIRPADRVVLPSVQLKPHGPRAVLTCDLLEGIGVPITRTLKAAVQLSGDVTKGSHREWQSVLSTL